MAGRSLESIITHALAFMEHHFTCPHCWEEISMVLDVSVATQTYVEDCEVCCQPIEVRYSIKDDVLIDFEANPTE
jgi:transcription elongation factor Elf1